MKRQAMSRRRLLATSTAACAATMAAPFVRRPTLPASYHSVSGIILCRRANKVSDQLIQAWAAKENVEIQIDRWSGTKATLTPAAEAQARSGHDILYMTSWLPHQYAE